MPPGKHSTLGASSSERWMACPGSVRMSEGMPNRSSRYAREGTAAHSLAERALRKGLDPDTWLGSTIRVKDWDGDEQIVEDIEVTEEMVEAVRVFVDLVNSRQGDGTELRLEERLDLSPLKPPLPMYGTGDAITWDPAGRTLYIDDLKYGQGVVVEAEDNTQLRYYGIGAVLAVRKRPERIVVTICQPRAHHHNGRVRSWEITYEQLVDFKAELLSAAHATQEPNAPLVAGDHCRFCPAAPKCPALHALSVEVAQSEFQAVAADTLPEPKLLTMEELTFVLDKANIIENWFAAVREHALSVAEAGGTVPGYKLVEGRTNRRWADEGAAEEALEEALGDAAFAPRKLLSPAQAEKALKAIGVKLDPELVVKPEGKKKLAPDGDARPGLLPTAVEDFS